MKILIIGGSGFIGWKLLETINDGKNDIIVYNRGNKNRIYPNNVRHIIGDRANIDLLSDIVKKEKFDIVYDMCCFTVDQIKNLIPIFNGKVKRYVFISTSAVYLDNQVLPLKETSACGFHPQWGTYGNNKYECEKLLLNAFKNDKFPVTIIRPTYVYGVGNIIDRETFLFDRIEKNIPLFVPFSGEAVIQLGYISDLCEALKLLISLEKGFGEVYNISGSEYITLNGLIKKVSEIIGKDTKIYYLDPQKYGFSQREIFPFESNTYFVTIEKFKKDFGWEPLISLEEGLKKSYIAWKNGEYEITPKYDIENKLITLLKEVGVY